MGRGLESSTGTTAAVQVAVVVHTEYAAAPPQDKRRRLRIRISRIGDQYKSSTVEFLPSAGAAAPDRCQPKRERTRR